MKIHKYLIITIVITLFFLTGCNSQEEPMPSSTPYVGGQTGLSMEFLQDLSTLDIYDNSKSQFSIGLKIENLGEQDINEEYNGYVEIKGINPKNFGLNSQEDLQVQPIPSILATRKTIDGGIVTEAPVLIYIPENGDLSYNQDLPGDMPDVNINAEACYDYKTKATTYLCLKRDLLENIDRGEICQADGEKIVYNSGAPVHVTQLTQQPSASGKIQIRFQIEHVGQEEDVFYKIDSETGCYDNPTNRDRWMVKVTPHDVNDKPVECSNLNGGYVRLFNGEPTQVTCTVDVSDVDSEFISIFNIDLEYKYSQLIGTSFTIKDVE